jgi:hypothetical protein
VGAGLPPGTLSATVGFNGQVENTGQVDLVGLTFELTIYVNSQPVRAFGPAALPAIPQGGNTTVSNGLGVSQADGLGPVTARVVVRDGTGGVMDQLDSGLLGNIEDIVVVREVTITGTFSVS